jgi:hypothetical protein
MDQQVVKLTYQCHEFLQRSIGICAREYAALKGSSKTEVKNSVKNLSEKQNVEISVGQGPL